MDAQEAREHTAALFRALGSPKRLEMLERISTDPCSVSELAEFCGISQPLASQHLRALREVGAVRPDRQGRAVLYRIVDEHVAHIVGDAVAHAQEEHHHD